ncbi:hypothetical protein [Lysobacter sp. CA196]|uniref:hypothetical protein n=1 Tax=Lysobacter sp. CA196 TaxID=3455606 RepID=UPI003F8D5580
MSSAAAPVASVAATSASGMVDTLLRTWETAYSASPAERALGLLAAAWPEYDRSHWRRLCLGDRDACLLLLQKGLFGGRLHAVAACPACGDRLETDFDAGEVCPLPTQMPSPREPLLLEHKDYRIYFRPPCSDDIAALDDGAGRGEGATLLLQRCVVSAHRGREPVAAAQLPTSLRRRVIAAMADHDPLADLRLAVECPSCRHAWSASLDVAGYLWEELDDWAQDLLAEVHVLARHYAWCERDILAMAPTRRRFYLDMVQA